MMHRNVKIAGLVLAALVCGWVFQAVKTRGLVAAQAQNERDSKRRKNDSEENSEPRDEQRWEYCAITKSVSSPSFRRSSYLLSYFKTGGAQIVEIDEAATERGGLARTIAKLGDDGWEMVGSGALEFKQNFGAEALYFKRRR